MRMTEYAAWQKMICEFGMPDALEVSALLANLNAMVGNIFGGKDDGTPYTPGDVLPRLREKRPVLRDVAGNVISKQDPLGGRIAGTGGKEIKHG